MHMFSVKLTFPADQFEKHIESIMPDLEQEVGRSKTRIERSGAFFYIYIDAPDTVSLRASIGSLTRWLSIADKVFKEVE